MKIHIAAEQIVLNVPYDRQIAVRETERSVNKLFDTWRQRFPKKSDSELLTMITFQYASHYSELAAALSQSLEEIDRLGAYIDEALGNGSDETSPTGSLDSIDSDVFIPDLPS